MPLVEEQIFGLANLHPISGVRGYSIYRFPPEAVVLGTGSLGSRRHDWTNESFGEHTTGSWRTLPPYRRAKIFSEFVSKPGPNGSTAMDEDEPDPYIAKEGAVKSAPPVVVSPKELQGLNTMQGPGSDNAKKVARVSGVTQPDTHNQLPVNESDQPQDSEPKGGGSAMDAGLPPQSDPDSGVKPGTQLGKETFGGVTTTILPPPAQHGVGLPDGPLPTKEGDPKKELVEQEDMATELANGNEQNVIKNLPEGEMDKFTR